MASTIPASMFSSPVESATPSPTPSPTAHPDGPFADQPTYSSSTHTTSEHSPSNAALISGLAVAAFIVILSICAICWFARHKIAAWWRGGRSTHGRGRGGWKGDESESMRLKSVDNTPSTVTSEWEVRREYPPPPPPTTAKASTAATARSGSTNWTRNDIRSNSTAASHCQGRDAGLGFSVPGFPSNSKTQRATRLPGGSQSQRTLNHGTSSLPRIPEIQTPAHELDATPSPQSRGQALPQAYLNRSLPASPSISSVPLPITPATATETTTSPTSTAGVRTPTDQQPLHQRHQGGPGKGAAYTPSIYQPFPPTSLPHPRAGPHGQSHPALLTPGAYTPPQPYPHSFTTLASPPPPTPTNQPTTFASPSPPQQPPPPTTTAPSPLPNPPSTISLGSTASLYRRLDSSIDLYRGLSFQRSPRRPGDAGAMRPVERPPWDFLSAEDAVGGGWRNSTGTVAGSVEGWETIREEEEEGERERGGGGKVS